MNQENITDTLNQALFNNHFGNNNPIDKLYNSLEKIQSLAEFLRDAAILSIEADNRHQISNAGLAEISATIETHARDANLILNSASYKNLMEAMP